MDRNQNYMPKVIAVVSLLALGAAVMIARESPASGYELDIYGKTPTLTWALIFTAILGGATIIVDQVIRKGYQTSRIWMLGLLILVLSHFSILVVPHVRGYFTWSGDTMSHWGDVKTVLDTGNFDRLNFYPITHSVLSQIVLVTEMPLRLVGNVSEAFLSGFFVISSYLLSTAVLRRREQQLLAAAIAAVVFIEADFHFVLVPNGWSIFMLPLVFYFYFKSQSERSYVVLFLILLITYPIFHPLSSLMLGVFLLGIFFIGLPVKALLNRKDNLANIRQFYLPLVFGIVELGMLVAWLRSFEMFGRNLTDLLDNIGRIGRVLGAMGDTLSKINVQGGDLVLLYLKSYGADTILVVLSLTGLILVLRQIRKSAGEFLSPAIVDVGLMFLMSGLAYLLYLAGALGLVFVGEERGLHYIMLLTPGLAAVGILSIGRNLKSGLLSYVVVILLLLIPAVASFRGLYYSPYVLQPNLQLTEASVAGFDWTISEKDRNISVSTISVAAFRYFDIVLGTEAARGRPDNHDGKYYINVQFADHFGYGQYATLGEQYPDGKYAGIVTLDRSLYSAVWGAVGRFNDADFAALERDRSVSKVYSNGGMDLFYTRRLTP